MGKLKQIYLNLLKALKPCLLLLSTLAAKMSLAYVILDLVFSEYAMKGIFQYSVKRTLVVLKIDNETNVRVDVAADTNEIPFLKRRGLPRKSFRK